MLVHVVSDRVKPRGIHRDRVVQVRVGADLYTFDVDSHYNVLDAYGVPGFGRLSPNTREAVLNAISEKGHRSREGARSRKRPASRRNGARSRKRPASRRNGAHPAALDLAELRATPFLAEGQRHKAGTLLHHRAMARHHRLVAQRMREANQHAEAQRHDAAWAWHAEEASRFRGPAPRKPPPAAPSAAALRTTPYGEEARRHAPGTLKHHYLLSLHHSRVFQRLADTHPDEAARHKIAHAYHAAELDRLNTSGRALELGW